MTIDITPTPRILRTLGEIPFQPWQCLAELIDNSIDAFEEAERRGALQKEKKIIIAWSGENVAANQRVIEIIDTGLGMDLETLQNAARAGYSSNDPINNLGLFGMGFNIATARLGEKTCFLSTRKGDKEWRGIEIDFSELIRSKSFIAPIISEPKNDAEVSGTKVVIYRLKGDTYRKLRDQEGQVRRQLENIYTPLLGSKTETEVFVQSKKLSPHPHCVWSSSRYVTREGKNIPAVYEINRDLGVSFFDIDRNAYLSRDEQENLRYALDEGSELPKNIIERHKRLTGWIGIQRYSDPNDFGVDFVRNGRKILIANKDLFSYENPMTGTSVLEYPVELGTTVGGRIVGEIHVDYLLPTYQKNDFDRTDPSWMETMEYLRGVGPILPKSRKAMGYKDSNESPVALLANAYRRPDPGTKNLFVEKSLARSFAEYFRKGDPTYQSDDKWWQAALEADKRRASGNSEGAPEVDEGSAPSDNADEYGPAIVLQSDGDEHSFKDKKETNDNMGVTSSLDELISNSDKVVSLSGAYSYSDTPSFQVKVWELKTGGILKEGESIPFLFTADGMEHDFVYNPRHSFLTQFQAGSKEILSIYLAERFKARDGQKDIGMIFANLFQRRFQDYRIDKMGLQERAGALFSVLREKMQAALVEAAPDVIACIHESAGDVEETVNSMIANGGLIKKFQECSPDAVEALYHVPNRALVRLVARFPDRLFDGKVFAAPYESIALSDEKATERVRSEAKDRIVSFLKDCLWVLNQGSGASPTLGKGKDELARCSHSISFLEQEICD